MKSFSPKFKKTKKRMGRIIKDVRKHIKVFSIEDIFKNQDGTILAYIKEIKEIDDLAIVRLKGAIDSRTIPIIRANLGSDVEKYLDKHILLDLKEVTRIDSATLASLIQLLGDLKVHNKKLGIINMTHFLKNYLSIAKLESVVCVYKDEKSAIKDLLQS
ncbi:MAG: STAS domain-containing protein [Candidatus Omnitrophica bacterium]|nr:STAS domain-containing protein [Candidatus Omnitrophota bacterium]